MWRIGCLTVCMACGKLGFESVASDGPPADSACATPTPQLAAPPSVPFGAPVLVTELNAPGGSDDPTLTADQLEIFFESARDGTARIWRATRATRSDPWSVPAPVVELDGTGANTPEVSRDGLTMYFSSSVVGISTTFVVTRTDRSSGWGTPRRISELTIAEGITGVAPFFDGRAVMYYTPASGGPGNGDLWLTFLGGEDCAVFGNAVPLPGNANTTNSESNGWIRNDGLAVAFQSIRAGGTGAGDLLVATRSSLDVGFEPAIEQVALDTAQFEDDPWLSDAMDVIYFVRNAELYVATR